MLPDSSIISKKINNVEFGYYSPEEIRMMSVKEITNPKAFDKLGHPLKSGLYDPAMGVQPHERGTRCITCGQENLDCPGHVGHIELLLPVYNPYLITHLMGLLRSKCFHCHRLKLTKDKKQYFKNRFKLLRFGKLVELKQYEQLHQRRVKALKQTNRKQSLTTEATRKDSDSKLMDEITIDVLKPEIKQLLSVLNVKEHWEDYSQGIHITSHILIEIKQLLRQFYKDINKKCPHCNKLSQSIRKEGVSKFFIINKSEEKNKNQYLNALEVQEHIRLLWQWDSDLLKYMFGSVYINENAKKGYILKSIEPQNFFIEVLAVTANRFRPENKVNDQTFLHGHTVVYTRILELNQELRIMITNLNNQQQLQNQQNLQFKSSQQADFKRIIKLESVFQKWLELQDCVVGLFNSERAQNKANRETPGVKQLLERKLGLFRMKMMGKRVNFACRSVISPDPLLSTNEVGVPMMLAKKLIIPENVNHLNQSYVAELIMNAQQYPGALFFQSQGKKIALEFLNQQQRMAIVRELGSEQEKVVWRHLRTGDVMLFNRQPSLHKPSIMAHIVRVLPNEQTIRFHYANCKSYNADFDGDEMNLHFVQNHMARSEAYNIALNDNQYISQTNGKPLRELMQDMIVSSVFLTLRDSFLERHEYQQLIYQAVCSLYQNDGKKIFLLTPTILKPKQLWTGKQLISNIMKIIVELNGFDPNIGLNMDGKSKFTKNELPGIAIDDTQVIIKNNELLLGVVDKNQLGSGVVYGMLHGFYELYGPKMTGQLLTALARLFTAHLQTHGFTCGMDDLIVEHVFEQNRAKLIQENLRKGVEAAAKYCGYTGNIPDCDFFNRPLFHTDEQGAFKYQQSSQLKPDDPLVKCIEEKMLGSEKNVEAALDGEYKRAMGQNTSEVINSTLSGLSKLFPHNLFSFMTLSGAKGSTVNHSQVSALLSQQELEGRRVPLMPTGRSLPSFIPYDPNPRAGGYVADRFLTGLRPQEFFFHCMAGREGLIDTAVKTSRSGYLQRCLVKHLEGLVVQYDLSVRDSDGSMIQYYYGEDGIDTIRTKYLEKFNFLSDNYQQYNSLYKIKEFKKKFENVDQYDISGLSEDTLMNTLNPTHCIGAVSTKIHCGLNEFLKKEKEKLKSKGLGSKDFKDLAHIKFMRSLMHPGEAVGCVAAQSIGEPSTQMTLNTFHLAGHGDKNVTLGIPRLREILMTATKNLQTPFMQLQFLDQNIDKIEAERYARRMSKLTLLELVNNIMVKEYKRLVQNETAIHQNQRGVIYEIEIKLEDLECIEFVFGINKKILEHNALKKLIPLLIKIIQSELSKRANRQYEKPSQFLKNKDNNIPNRKRRESDDEQDEDDEQDLEQEEDLELSFMKDITAEQSMITNQQQQQKEQKEQKSSNIETIQQNKYIEAYEFKNDTISITLKLPLNSKKILMTNLVKKSLSNTIIHEIKGISKAKVSVNHQGTPKYSIITDGVNLKALKNFDFINHYNVDSNDIVSILHNYGVEAARNVIIKEIVNVFKVYGVEVDYRHLYLIADYMTFCGQVKAMNRIWMDFNTSPFGKMTFETSTHFLTNACMNRETDGLSNISAQLVMGRIPKIGTNLCDIMVQFPNDLFQ